MIVSLQKRLVRSRVLNLRGRKLGPLIGVVEVVDPVLVDLKKRGAIISRFAKGFF